MSKNESSKKTNAAVDEEHLSADAVAAKLGEDIACVYKTIVLRGDRNGYFVCVVRGDSEIDLKEAARISGNKRAELIHVKELLPLTGYIRGGCSPIGMKKPFPTYYQASITEHPYVYVSAGMRGLQLKIAPADLILLRMTLTANTSLISHIGSTVLLTLFLILILGIAVCAILSFVPRRPYLDCSSGMIVQPFLMLSSPLRFPLNRIQIKDIPEGLMLRHLLRHLPQHPRQGPGLHLPPQPQARPRLLRVRRTPLCPQSLGINAISPEPHSTTFCLYFAHSLKSMTFRTFPQDAPQQISGTFDVSVSALFR